MKIVVALEALPWESFKIGVKDAEGNEGSVQAHSTASLAGFLPIYWSEAAAKAALPHATVQEIEVADDWHPMLEVMRKAAVEATPTVVEEIVAE